MSAQQIADIVILGGAVAFGVYGMWRGAIRQLGSVDNIQVLGLHVGQIVG